MRHGPCLVKGSFTGTHVGNSFRKKSLDRARVHLQGNMKGQFQKVLTDSSGSFTGKHEGNSFRKS